MVFGTYARYYDTIYRNKNYARECRYIESLFRRHSPRKVRTVLDLGCGTANHMIPLIRKGYRLSGVDASSSMLDIASAKLGRYGFDVDLQKARLQSFRLDGKYDAVLCLFSVIDYITSLRELRSTLTNVSRHMKKGSLFILDFWNETAVENYYRPRKRNVFRRNGNILERSSTTAVYPARNICEVRYTCTLKKGRRPAEHNQEKHVLRYFSVEEMQAYLEQAGLHVLDTHPFMNPLGTIRKNTWDVTIVARKK